eukprot:TRINITY_DN827_c1_g2_i2.p1 TRINITY_DN827_c1_g2~~TRINITY_DN827_c1_g2_i2.p1  ORF type:complete len:302 (-),score=61.12 TRINITY_DN827_c1_g2_i2:73-978(-)
MDKLFGWFFSDDSDEKKSKIVEAYSDPLFADYYDYMVDALPPEFEVGTDVEFYSNLLIQKNPQKINILDLAAGSGRISYGIAKKFSENFPQVQLKFILVDNSKEMIKIAKNRAPEINNATFEYFVGDMSNFSIDLEQKLVQQPVDFVVIGAGSIHHLLHNKQINQLFSSVKGALKRDGIFVATLLPLNDIVPSKEDLNEQQKMQRDKYGFIRQTKQILVQMDEDGDKEQVVRSEFDVFDPKGKMASTFWTLRVFGAEKIVQMLDSNGFRVCGGWKSFKDALNQSENGEIIEGSKILLSKIK